MDVGIGEWMVLVLLVWLIPMGVLYRVANARGQEGRYALWGLLSYAGLIVGILVMMAMPRPQPATESEPKPSSDPKVF